MLRRLAALALLALAGSVAAAPDGFSRSTYPTSGTCAGLPRIVVMTPAGTCMALIAEGLKFPRGLLALSKDRFLVADMGGWGKNLGRIWQFDRDGGGFKRNAILSKLDRPHGIEKGPDGKIYVGIVGGVLRFDMSNPRKTLEQVIGGKAAVAGPPGDGLHPLVSLLFTSRGTLLVNGGSRTNNCEGENGAPPPQGVACPETRGADAHGVVREYSFDWSSGKATGFVILAEGLRNSLALAEAKNGQLLQGENSRDDIGDYMPELADDENLPPDEINILTSGAHYGWPYCYGANIASPDYPGFDCAAMTKPFLELPAHAAPLSMVWYEGGLLIAYHGYRANGHRIVRFELNADGLPVAPATEFVSGWDGEVGPQGAPVDLEPLPGENGLLISEDRNGTILLLTEDR